MPLYYNVGAPTPTTRNTINEVAVTYGIRDFLLNLNLLPQYPQISTAINGSPKIGEPVLDTSVGTGNVLVPIGLPLETNGIIWKDLNVIYNTFQNDPNVANTLEEIDFIPAISNPDFGQAIWPTNSQYPIGANSQIDQYGLKAKTEIAEYRKDNVIKNLYLDSTSQIDVADFITMFPLDISQQLGNYVDVFGGLNQGGTAGDQTLNVIGSVLNGQGVGLGAGGSVIPNFDFKSSLAGRVLGAAGFVKDTKLGNVGAQQLALALANNAAFNVQQELLGALNVKENIYSLIKDGELAGFRPSYKITVASSTGGQLLTGAAQILGFQIPRSYLGDAGSIFQSENGDAGNINRANAMIENTGKGQVKALISSMLENLKANESNGGVDKNPFRSGYAPAFNDDKGEPMSDPKIYGYYYSSGEGTSNGDINKILGNAGDYIPTLNYLREQITSDSGFKSPEELVFVGYEGGKTYNDRKISDVMFSWGGEQPDALNAQIVNGQEYSQINGDKKSLLVKTQKLFNSKGMKNIVSVKGDMEKSSTQIQTANGNGFSKGSAVLKAEMYDLNTGTYIGKKNATADETYCRSWTTLDRYDSISKLIRNKPLYTDPDVAYRNQTEGSVLDGPFVKIAPYASDVPTDPKKFMFSIENLAWKDNVADLPPCEQGNGDMISGEKGRIMWFPPYDIQFSENNTVNWDESNFIGRGEPIYTYNNTKRSGQLSFKIIVDHPSYFNAFREENGSNGPDDNFIASFFAGCVDVDKRWADKLTTSQIQDIRTETIEIPQEKNDPTDPPLPDVMKVYYPNDVKVYDPEYEDAKCPDGSNVDYEQNCDGFGCGLGSIKADVTQKDVNGRTLTWEDRYDFGLNQGRNSTTDVPTVVIGPNAAFGFNDDAYRIDMVEFLKQYPWAVVNFKGYASPQGNPTSNTTLANTRAQLLRDKLLELWGPELGLSGDKLQQRFKVLKGVPLSQSDVPDCPVETKQNPNPPTDILPCKLARRVEISVSFDPNLKAEYIKGLQPKKPETITKTYDVTKEIKNKFYTECNYFEKLTEKDKFVFDSIRKKIKYFHPAFHSTTPEGLNSRLTFLLQCTRQGPTLESVGANNLAFGRPPVCILRIGDFYHTKIVIENVNIGYEPLVWDLNPEGIGVQPMIANVDINFNFLGGSSLMGPISKLQNALSFNYFANTHVYDPRADYISKNRPFTIQTEVNPDSEEGVVITAKKVPVPESPTGYYINNGIKSYDKYTTESILNEELRAINGQDLNQILEEQLSNSGFENSVQPSPSATTTGTTSGTTGMDDLEVLSCFGIQGYWDFELDEINSGDFGKDNLSLSFRFQFQSKFDIDRIALNKIQKGKFYLKNSTTKRKELLASFVLSPNGNESIGFAVIDDEQNDPTGTPLSFVGKDNKTLLVFQVDVYVNDNESKVSFIRDSYRTSGTSLDVEWDNSGGAKIAYGWNKNYASDK